MAAARPTPADGSPAAGRLPELAAVPWRPRMSRARLGRRERQWTATTLAHVVPFLATATLLAALDVRLVPVSLFALAFAWGIPELYAARGAGVLRRRETGAPYAERRALGLLGDLVGHATRDTLASTGYAVEPARLGVWVIGPAGAVLVRPGGRRVHCLCVRVSDAELPVADRVAHLLLALREDEAGFATVANLAFSGAAWRLARRLPPPARRALADARTQARRSPVAAGRAAEAT